LDLFAGTGALGLEALSRGATHVTFVDDGRKALSLIKQNIALTKSADETQVLTRDATKLSECSVDPYDLVFLDPPYGKSLGQAALSAAMNGGWLTEDALIVWEENAPMMALDGFAREDTRKYGDTHVTILSRTD
jgi:16S rRNA (guanine966-N2)-methyltransferase